MSIIATTVVPLSTIAWTNCGTGPLQLSALDGSIVYQISDEQPTVPAPGYPLRVGDKPVQVTSTSTIWAIPAALDAASNALVSA